MEHTAVTRRAGNSNKVVWIGLVGLTPLPGNEFYGERPGAYTNFIALAGDRTDYEQEAKKFFALLKFSIREIEEAEPFKKRAAKYNLDQSLLELAKEVDVTGVSALDTIYTYRSEEDPNE